MTLPVIRGYNISWNFDLPIGLLGYWVDWLSAAQMKQGHEVYVVAPEGGENKAKNIPIPLWSTEEEIYKKTFQKTIDLRPDIVHDHTFSQLFRRNHPEIKAVSTHHNERFTMVPNTIYPTLADARDNNSDVFVHHGLNIEEYSYSEEKEGYLLFLGAVHPRKNTHLAIELTQKSNSNLIIAGPVSHPGYFCKKIRKQLSDKIVYRGEVFGVIKKHLLSKAKGLIYPSSWESFGISVIEAMVSGTPVITSNIPPFLEIIDNGKTGFICAHEKNIFGPKNKEYIEAINNVSSISSKACRDWVLERFTNDKMAEKYESLYKKAMNGECW